MMRILFAAAVAAAVLALGCTGGQVKPVAVLPPSEAQPQQAQQEPARQPGNLLEAVWDTPMSAARDTKFFSAASAEQCPTINVETASGKEIEIQPGMAGYVTLVAVFAMDYPSARNAARHVSALQRQYGRIGRVRAIGIVENTKLAAKAEEFAGQTGITYTLYYDNKSAVEKLAKAAGAETPDVIPAIFIIDRQLRLRFYRPGFPFFVTSDPDTGEQQLKESAPDGQSIDDYLQKILAEG